jgi:hypothetical protein
MDIDQPNTDPTVEGDSSPPLTTKPRRGGLRRLAATLALAGALLAIGGVSAVAAASPDPSASTTPSTQGASGSGTTTPKAGCPAHSGTNGSSTSPSASPGS